MPIDWFGISWGRDFAVYVRKALSNWGMIEGAEAHGWTLLPTVYGAAMPGGLVTEVAYQTLLQALLDRLIATMPVDGILLVLRGAMVTKDHLDVECHSLEQVRQVVGAEIPIVVVLDMHGNINQRTVELVEVLVAFDTNPHLDPHARGVEATDILARLLSKTINPTATITIRLCCCRPRLPEPMTCRSAPSTSGRPRWKQTPRNYWLSKRVGRG